MLIIIVTKCLLIQRALHSFVNFATFVRPEHICMSSENSIHSLENIIMKQIDINTLPFIKLYIIFKVSL